MIRSIVLVEVVEIPTKMKLKGKLPETFRVTELYSQYEIFYCLSCLISIIAPLLAMIIEYKM